MADFIDLDDPEPVSGGASVGARYSASGHPLVNVPLTHPSGRLDSLARSQGASMLGQRNYTVYPLDRPKYGSYPAMLPGGYPAAKRQRTAEFGTYSPMYLSSTPSSSTQASSSSSAYEVIDLTSQDSKGRPAQGGVTKQNAQPPVQNVHPVLNDDDLSDDDDDDDVVIMGEVKLSSDQTGDTSLKQDDLDGVKSEQPIVVASQSSQPILVPSESSSQSQLSRGQSQLGFVDQTKLVLQRQQQYRQQMQQMQQQQQQQPTGQQLALTHEQIIAQLAAAFSETDERSHSISPEICARNLQSKYGAIVNVTNTLIKHATGLYDRINKLADTLSYMKVAYVSGRGTYASERTAKINLLDTMSVNLRRNNRRMYSDAEKLRHNKHEVQREWRYKLEVRNSLIKYGKVPPKYQHAPGMQMMKVNIGEYRTIFGTLNEDFKRMSVTTLRNVLSANSISLQSWDGTDDSAQMILERWQQELQVSKEYHVSKGEGLGQPVTMAGADRGAQFYTMQRNALNTQQQQQQQPRNEWWNDPAIQIGSASSLDYYRRREREAADNYMYNPSAYTSTDEATSLKNLVDSIQPDAKLNSDLEDTPAGMTTELLKHQRLGVTWMLSKEKSKNKGGILADDMGLGKTVQALAIMLLNRSEDAKCKTNLIVAPVSLLQQWAGEVRDKIAAKANFNCYIFHQANRAKTFEELQKYDVVMVSYNTLASEWKKHYALAIAELKRKKSAALPDENDGGGSGYRSPFFASDAKFYRVILDEAQFVKNKMTNASRSVSNLKSEYKWCMSGTPMQNNVDELYPLLRFMQIEPYCDESRFKDRIAAPIRSGWMEKKAYERLHALLSAILLRRTKSTKIDGEQILKLPEKHVYRELVAMNDKEQEFYKVLEENSAEKAQKLLALSGNGQKGNGTNYSSILTLLLRMRQACDHYYLVQLSDDKERTLKSEDLRNAFKSCRQFNAAIIKVVDRQREESLTCQRCGDPLIESSANFLGGCGHVICSDCVDAFFEENLDTVWNGDRSAHCTVCNKTCIESGTVMLAMYDAVVKDKLTWQQVKKKFGIENKSLDKSYRWKKMKELIEKDGGKVASTAKIAKCIELIQDIERRNPREKIIIFSQFMMFFDLLQIVLCAKGYEGQYLRYDGSMDVGAKDEAVRKFYRDDTKKILLLSLKAGNVGLTLTCANHVIILEPFWNPFVERQAQDRVHRIGQSKEVFVHRILIKGTVEDRIMDLQEKKEMIVNNALDPSGIKHANGLSRKDLGYLFGLNDL